VSSGLLGQLERSAYQRWNQTNREQAMTTWSFFLCVLPVFAV
jgi:hypothetical protein